MCNKLLFIYLFTRGNSDANDMLWMMMMMMMMTDTNFQWVVGSRSDHFF